MIISDSFVFTYRVRSLDAANAKVAELVDGAEDEYIVCPNDGYIEVYDTDGNKVLLVTIVD